MSTATLPVEVFAQWLATGERGLSSEAIVSHLTGQQVGRWANGDYPHDVGDFRRCELLLRSVPAARIRFHGMARVNAVWAALVPAWYEIVALIESEVPDAFVSGYWRGGSAPKAYTRIRELIDSARLGVAA